MSLSLLLKTRVAPAWEEKKMFGNLIESGSHTGDHARKGKFFLSALAVYVLAFLAIGVAGIYAYDIHLDTLDLRVISLVTPVEASEIPMPHRASAPSRPAGGDNGSREIVLREKPTIAVNDPTLAKDKTPVSSHAVELPPGVAFRIDPNAGENIFAGPGNGTRSSGGDGDDTSGGIARRVNELVRETPPPAIKLEPTKPPEAKRIQSMGVVNGMATYLPKPAYTALAKAAHASGTVTVQVTIDESGKVISAKAISGHPLLLRESVQAAYQARFTPTLLSNQPVKVTGIITYNFMLG